MTLTDAHQREYTSDKKLTWY